jgi:hypothetical protein
MGRVIVVSEEYTTIRSATEADLLAWGATELEIEVLFGLDLNKQTDLNRYYNSRINDLIQQNADHDINDGFDKIEFSEED